MNVWKNLAVFAAVYIPTLAVVWWALRDRRRERCHRCGSLWKRTEHGGEFHLCTKRSEPEWDRSVRG